MPVDSAFALYLQSGERTYVAADATLDARWGSLARTYEASSALAAEADAITETGRQIAFLGGPVAEYLVTIGKPLDVSAYRGRCHTIGGTLMFVLGGDCDHGAGITRLNTLGRL